MGQMGAWDAGLRAAGFRVHSPSDKKMKEAGIDYRLPDVYPREVRR